MAIVERYVRADAAGGGDGTTDSASGANGAFTWAEMVTQINTPTAAGYRYNVKAGTYSLSASTTLTGDGTSTSPCIIRGFNSTIGDLSANRSAGGALNLTNVPVIAYSNTFNFNATGTTHLILQSLSFTGNIANSLVITNDNSLIYSCSCVNNSSSSSARGFDLSGQDALIVNCDASLPSGASAARVFFVGGSCVGCRVTNSGSATGIHIGNNNGRSIAFNTITECSIGIAKTTTGAVFTCFNNTISNCSGDGIDVVTSSTASTVIYGNHITGCGGYGVDYNTSTCVKILFNNRFRDNTSGAINGGGDWETGSSIRHITSDDTDALDFTDESTNDFSLKAGAAAISGNVGYLVDIGANGTPIVSGSGGSALHLGSLGQTGIGVF